MSLCLYKAELFSLPPSRRENNNDKIKAHILTSCAMPALPSLALSRRTGRNNLVFPPEKVYHVEEDIQKKGSILNCGGLEGAARCQAAGGETDIGELALQHSN